VKEAWWTNTDRATNEKGMAEIPAVLGEYAITVEADGHPVVRRTWTHRAKGDLLWIQVFGKASSE